MIINTDKAAINKRLGGFILTIAIGSIVAAILTTDLAKNGLFGLNKTELVVAVIAIYLLILLYNFIMDYHYIYYNDNDNKIIIKYYALRPLSKKHNVIEIPKNKLKKFQLKKSLMNLRDYLVLYQQMNKGTAKYPPLNISMLKNDQKKQLKKSLTQIINN